MNLLFIFLIFNVILFNNQIYSCCCCNQKDSVKITNNDIITDSNEENVNLEEYVELEEDKKPEFIIDFSTLEEKNRKIKYVFLKKPIEWENNWCMLIAEIQSIFAIPSFFEYLANGDFKEPKYKHLQCLQKLLLEMIENEKDSNTKTFSEQKFTTYYTYLINNNIKNLCEQIIKNGKKYCKVLKYDDFFPPFSLLSFINFFKCGDMRSDSVINYENSNIIYLGCVDLRGGQIKKYSNTFNEKRIGLGDYIKNKNLKIRILIENFGDDLIHEIKNRYFNSDTNENLRDIIDSVNYDLAGSYTKFVLIIEDNCKNEINSLIKKLKESWNDFVEYSKIINEIFFKFKFKLNSIILYDWKEHIFNINYNEAEDVFYSYNSYKNKDITPIDRKNVIKYIFNKNFNVESDILFRPFFFVTVVRK